MKTRKNSIRLKNYDYSSAGYYFVTILTYRRRCLFGFIRDRQMYLNHFGNLVMEVWNSLPEHYPHVVLDEIVIMPDHVHAIIKLKECKLSHRRHGLPEIVRALKTFSARLINSYRQTQGTRVWHRSYHDYVIWKESQLLNFRRYIRANPAKWKHPHNKKA